jgi:hypothetical protein
MPHDEALQEITVQPVSILGQVVWVVARQGKKDRRITQIRWRSLRRSAGQ